MKKLALSLAVVLSATMAFGQTLSKEELKAQKREIKSLMLIAKDAERSEEHTSELQSLG